MANYPHIEKELVEEEPSIETYEDESKETEPRKKQISKEVNFDTGNMDTFVT